MLSHYCRFHLRVFGITVLNVLENDVVLRCVLCISGPVKPKAAEESKEQDEVRGEKRKRGQGSSEEETQVEDKNQEAKKVCKGFQLSAPIVLLPEDVSVLYRWDVMFMVSLCRCRSSQADGVCFSETWRER